MSQPVDVQQEWVVRSDWTGSEVQQVSQKYRDEARAKAYMAECREDPEIRSAEMLSRTVTVSPWVVVPDGE